METQNTEEQKQSKGNYVGKKFITRARQLQKDEGLEAEIKKCSLPSGLANAKVPKCGQLCLEEQGVPPAPLGTH